MVKAGLFALFLTLGAPLPTVEAVHALEEEAFVEGARSGRRPTGQERRQARLHRAPAAPASVPIAARISIVLEPTAHVHVSRIGSRPPPIA